MSAPVPPPGPRWPWLDHALLKLAFVLGPGSLALLAAWFFGGAESCGGPTETGLVVLPLTLIFVMVVAFFNLLALVVLALRSLLNLGRVPPGPGFWAVLASIFIAFVLWNQLSPRFHAIREMSESQDRPIEAHGQVLDLAGQPVAGATVEVSVSGWALGIPASRKLSLTSDAEGRFVVTGPDGAPPSGHMLRVEGASKPGWAWDPEAARPETIDFRWQDPPESLVVRMRRAGEPTLLLARTRAGEMRPDGWGLVADPLDGYTRSRRKTDGLEPSSLAFRVRLLAPDPDPDPDPGQGDVHRFELLPFEPGRVLFLDPGPGAPELAPEEGYVEKLVLELPIRNREAKGYAFARDPAGSVYVRVLLWINEGSFASIESETNLLGGRSFREDDDAEQRFLERGGYRLLLDWSDWVERGRARFVGHIGRPLSAGEIEDFMPLHLEDRDGVAVQMGVGFYARPVDPGFEDPDSEDPDSEDPHSEDPYRWHRAVVGRLRSESPGLAAHLSTGEIHSSAGKRAIEERLEPHISEVFSGEGLELLQLWVSEWSNPPGTRAGLKRLQTAGPS